ncbi:hypothetical protein, partial [Pseudomonas yangonensis]|uniref:hypothetical protein n=1 Tax=Pseudomonas yangonensis TaxID=2579922 RepID=UPI001C498C3E
FSVQFNKGQPESQALACIKNVLEAADASFGTKGAWYRKDTKDVEITLEEFSETQRKARKGLLSITETPVGSCMKAGDCAHRSYVVFSHCLT